MVEETFLFTPVPECEDLCLFICEITDLIVTDGFPISFFHTQLLKCRLILDIFPEVIAAPSPRTVNQIEIITREDYFQTNKLIKIYFENENLSLSEPQPVNVENYRECVIFTLKSKLSPTWIRVGQYLCLGNDFFTSETVNAIKFDIIIKKIGMILKFKFFKLKISPLELEDLQLFPSLINEFKQNPEGVVELGNYCWFHVLPSTFKARLLEVSKQIPKWNIFKNHQDLQKYWKNMYGYDLPETERMFYYKVCFNAAPNEVFLYPSICLCSEPPKIINCKNDAFTCIQFVEDLEKKVGSICGKTLSFEKTNLSKVKTHLSFIPARETKKTDPEFFSRLLSTGRNIKASNNKKIGNSSSRLKQQTLNFLTVPQSNTKILEASSEVDNSLENENAVLKIKSLEFKPSNNDLKLENFDSRLKQQTLNFSTAPETLTKFTETLSPANNSIKNKSVAFNVKNLEFKPSNDLNVGSCSSGLKQQMLNFPTASELSQKKSVIAPKTIIPEFSPKILSQYTTSTPIKRKLIPDPKVEEDSDSQSSATYKDLLNLIKYNQTSEKKNYKEKELLSFVMEEKSPPKKRVRIFNKKSIPPLESVSKYFRETKSTINHSVKNVGSGSTFQLLQKNYENVISNQLNKY